MWGEDKVNIRHFLSHWACILIGEVGKWGTQRTVINTGVEVQSGKLPGGSGTYSKACWMVPVNWAKGRGLGKYSTQRGTVSKGRRAGALSREPEIVS